MRGSTRSALTLRPPLFAPILLVLTTGRSRGPSKEKPAGGKKLRQPFLDVGEKASALWTGFPRQAAAFPPLLLHRRRLHALVRRQQLHVDAAAAGEGGAAGALNLPKNRMVIQCQPLWEKQPTRLKVYTLQCTSPPLPKKFDV